MALSAETLQTPDTKPRFLSDFWLINRYGNLLVLAHCMMQQLATNKRQLEVKT